MMLSNQIGFPFRLCRFDRRKWFPGPCETKNIADVKYEVSAPKFVNVLNKNTELPQVGVAKNSCIRKYKDRR
jgi:hypothetical protein